jgi:hypothetical protein
MAEMSKREIKKLLMFKTRETVGPEVHYRRRTRNYFVYFQDVEGEY